MILFSLLKRLISVLYVKTLLFVVYISSIFLDSLKEKRRFIVNVSNAKEWPSGIVDTAIYLIFLVESLANIYSCL
jgi:hypothetical protein